MAGSYPPPPPRGTGGMSLDPYLAAIRAMQNGDFSPAFPVEAEKDPLGLELRKLAATLELKCTETDLLQNIMHEVASGLLVDDVLDRIYDRFHSIIPYNRMALALLSEDRTILTQYWLRSDASDIPLQRGYAAPIKESSLQQVLETVQPRILNDLEAYLSAHPNSHSTRLIVNEGMRSNLTCPLITQGRPIGFLFFTSRNKNTYQHVHQQIFMHIAEQVSILVEKQCLAHKLRENEEERYKTIVRTALDGFWLVDAQGYLCGVNDAACELSGYRREELLGMHISDLEASEAPEETASHIERIIASGSDRFETRHRCKDGHHIDVEVSTNFIASNGGRFFAFLRDISARKRVEEEVKMKALLLDSVNDSVFLSDQRGIICYANETAYLTRGYAPQEMIGLDVRALNSPEYALLLQPRMDELQLRGHATFETVHLRKDGTALPVELNSRIIESNGNKFFLTVARDITEKKLAEEHARLAYHDTLTGLPNRRRLVDRIEHALARAKRYERLVAVMFLDLDNFKKINDTLGHDVGDEVLIAAAQKIARCVRQDDTISRLGGDEFVVLLSEISDIDDARSVANKILAEFVSPLQLGGQTLTLSSSIGISLYPDDGMNPSMLIAHADDAMYQAKRSGKGCVRVHGE
ncbi:MAG: diguanylate cyclase/phosphodiesterase with PAS/PAC sensor(s) [Gallionellaceae bacterium]|nr:MAG: diguanylate cyclase/phosphodiesterase with PAS/PAC sensor(s) [Gallionellaceae bacterium]